MCILYDYFMETQYVFTSKTLRYCKTASAPGLARNLSQIELQYFKFKVVEMEDITRSNYGRPPGLCEASGSVGLARRQSVYYDKSCANYTSEGGKVRGRHDEL